MGYYNTSEQLVVSYPSLTRIVENPVMNHTSTRSSSTVVDGSAINQVLSAGGYEEAVSNSILSNIEAIVSVVDSSVDDRMVSEDIVNTISPFGNTRCTTSHLGYRSSTRMSDHADNGVGGGQALTSMGEMFFNPNRGNGHSAVASGCNYIPVSLTNPFRDDVITSLGMQCHNPVSTGDSSIPHNGAPVSAGSLLFSSLGEQLFQPSGMQSNVISESPNIRSSLANNAQLPISGTRHCHNHVGHATINGNNRFNAAHTDHLLSSPNGNLVGNRQAPIVGMQNTDAMGYATAMRSGQVLSATLGMNDYQQQPQAFTSVYANYDGITYSPYSVQTKVNPVTAPSGTDGGRTTGIGNVNQQVLLEGYHRPSNPLPSIVTTMNQAHLNHSINGNSQNNMISNFQGIGEYNITEPVGNLSLGNGQFQLPSTDDTVLPGNVQRPTESENDNDWRTFQHNPRNIQERMILKGIADIKDLCNAQPHAQSDIEVRALESKDLPNLKVIQSSLVGRLEKLEEKGDMISQQIIDVGMAAHEWASEWTIRLVDEVKRRELHITSKSLGDPLILQPFDGWESSRSVYEFIKLFKVIARNLSTRDAGEYLFNNYLSTNLQATCAHVRHSYTGIVELLYSKFGDPERLLKKKLDSIRNLTHPTRNNKAQEFKYFKTVTETLNQMQVLVSDNEHEHPEIGYAVHNKTFVQTIVNALPGYTKSLLIIAWVKLSEDEYDGKPLPGKVHLKLVGKHVFNQYRSLEVELEQLAEDTRRDNPTKKINHIQNETPTVSPVKPCDQCAHAGTGFKPVPPQINQQTTSTNRAPYTPNSTQQPQTGWTKCTCFMHEYVIKKIRDCPMGKCDLFLKATPERRRDMAIFRGICICCFTFRCTKLSTDGRCVFKKDIPIALVCQDCLTQNNLDRNVLLCEQHKTNFNAIKKGLTEFLAMFEESSRIVLAFSMLKVSPVKIKENVKSDPNTYNVTNGTVISTNEIRNQLRQESKEDSLYMLQTLSFNDCECLTLFDTGASGAAVNGEFAKRAGFQCIDTDQQFIAVAGGGTIPTGYGIFAANLGPLADGSYQRVNMLGINRVTGSIPEYDLRPLVQEVKTSQVSTLLAKETFPPKVGGSEVHLILGMKESLLVPKLILSLPNGLMVFRSNLTDVHGSNIIFGGTHYAITEANRSIKGFHSLSVLFSKVYNGYKVALANDLPVLSMGKTEVTPVHGLSSCSITPIEKDSSHNSRACGRKGGTPCGCSNGKNGPLPFAFCTCCFETGKENVFTEKRTQTAMLTKKVKKIPLEKELDDQEDVGNKVSYRCPKCQNCQECLKADTTRERSIRETVEDSLIEESFEINHAEKKAYAKFPFIVDPVTHLSKVWGRSDNKPMAMKVFNQQRRKTKEIKDGIIEFHNEIATKGFVMPFSALPEDQQKAILAAPLFHYMLWRSVSKVSVSTPHRMVTDPSQSGFNDVIAKGSNVLNSLFCIALNWRAHVFAFTADVPKMYNSVLLDPSCYPYTLYFWSPNLDVDEEVELWLYITVTYGWCCSGNLVTAVLRRIANKLRDRYPRARTAIVKYTYMDDIGSGAKKKEEREKIIEEIEAVLPEGGFKLKVVCRSGEAPPPKASADGKFTSFVGYKWDSEEDVIMLGMAEMNFNQKYRGIKKPNPEPVDTVEKVQSLVEGVELTRRKILGKVMECYDTLGVLEPIKAKLKLDLKKLSGIDYDVGISQELQELWSSNLCLLHRAKEITVHRCFIPEDALDHDDLELFVFCDAAALLCGTVIYCKTNCQGGMSKARIITARSKSVSGTIPRNELEGILLGAETLFTVLKVIGDRVSQYTILTDSEIALAWCRNQDKPLKTYAFNRVLQIRRLVSVERIIHVAGDYNPADILTKGEVALDQLKVDGPWQNGPDWLTGDEESWPVSSFEDIRGRMSSEVKSEMIKETIPIPDVIVENAWTFSAMQNCCILPTETCHCEVGELCCNCRNNVFAEAACQLFEKVTISSTGNSAATMLTHVYAVAGVTHSVNDIVESINTEEVCLDVEVDDFSISSFLKLCKTKQKVATFQVDLVYRGFQSSLRIMSYVMRCVTRWRHRTHIRNERVDNACKLCKVYVQVDSIPVQLLDSQQTLQTQNPKYIVSQHDKFFAWKYLCRVASDEVRQSVSPHQLEKYEEKDGIFYSSGRMDQPVDCSSLMFKVEFLRPVALNSSDLVYALAIHLHWFYNHVGVERLMFLLLQIVHVEKVRSLCKAIRKSCVRCKVILKRTMQVEAGKQHSLATQTAPPFSYMQIDVASGFKAFDVKSRVTKKAYFLVGVCLITSAVSIWALEDLTTESVLRGLECHSSIYGWPLVLLPDLQSSFVTLEHVQFSFRDLQGKLLADQGVILDFCTPLHHQEHGKVEARVKLLKEYLQKAAENGFRHSFLQWESVGLKVAAFLNSLPIARGLDTGPQSDFGLMGVITPNHFLIGSNGNRALAGSCKIIGHRSEILDKVNKTSEFLCNLLHENLHRFLPGATGATDKLPTVGDIVIFVMTDNIRSRNMTWKYGKVTEILVDGRKGKVKIQYKNSSEVVWREVDRHVSQVVLLVSLDDLFLNTREHKIALEAQRRVLLFKSSK